MVDESSPQAAVGLQELPRLRSQTATISKLLHARLEGHLEVFRSLLAPRPVLGKYLGGSASRDDVSGADKTVAALEERYAQVAGKPFVLKAKLDRDVFKQLDSRLELYAWEYSHEANAGGETRTIDITSPARWVVSYASDYSLAQVRQVIAGREEKRSDDLTQFVVNALVMRAVFDKNPALTRLLADLRFQVSYETPAGMGKLPFVTISSDLTSFRPPDDLILSATGISGVDAFIELIDQGTVDGLRDPLRDAITEALA